MPGIRILSVIVSVHNSGMSAKRELTVVRLSYKIWNLGNNNIIAIQNKVLNRCFFLILNRQCGFCTVYTACDLRKQPPFYPTKISLRNDCRNSKLMTCHFSDLGVLLIGWFIPQMSFRGKTSSEGKTRLRLTQHQCTLYDLVFVFSIKEPSHDTEKVYYLQSSSSVTMCYNWQ